MSDIVRVKLADGSEVSVGASFAASHGLTVLDKPATDRRGKAFPAKPHVDISLKGRELDAALDAAGLPKDGRVADKQARLADYQANQDLAGQPGSGSNHDPNGGEDQ